jgi:hypothetical protein
MTTEAKWAARVAAWRASGQCTAEFCEGKGYRANTLRYWSSRLGRMAGQGRSPSEGTLREVRIAKVTPRAEPTEAESPIVIEVGGVRVGVRRGFDRAALRDVLGLLGGAE